MDTNTNLPSLTDPSRFLGKQLSGGDAAALNAQFGYDPARAEYDFLSGNTVYRVVNNGNGTRSVVENGTVSARQAAKAAADRQAAIQPAIKSYQDTIPEINSAYDTEAARLQGEQQPLKDRYQILLDSLKTQKTGDISAQTRITNSELAKRGITNDSTFAQQELFNTTNPINERYSNIERTTNLDESDALRAISDAITGLVPKRTADLRSITQAIADLQAGTGNQSVNDYLQLAQQGFANNYTNLNYNEQVKQNAINQALAQAQADIAKNQQNYITLGEGDTLFNPKTGQPVYSVPKTYKTTSAAAGGSGWGT